MPTNNFRDVPLITHANCYEYAAIGLLGYKYL